MLMVEEMKRSSPLKMMARIAWTILLTAIGSATADEIHGYFVDIQQGPYQTQISVFHLTM